MTKVIMLFSGMTIYNTAKMVQILNWQLQNWLDDKAMFDFSILCRYQSLRDRKMRKTFLDRAGLFLKPKSLSYFPRALEFFSKALEF